MTLASSKLWHRLRGHRITTPVFNAQNFAQAMKIRGFSLADTSALMPIYATRVVDQCSCGAEWMFSALTFSETYYPQGGVLTLPDARPRLP